MYPSFSQTIFILSQSVYQLSEPIIRVVIKICRQLKLKVPVFSISMAVAATALMHR